MMIKKPIAMLMAALMICLPIYTAEVFAVNELNVVSYSGDDDVDGYFDQWDRWLLEVDAKIDTDTELTPEQVKVNGYDFMECSSSTTGYFSCIYTGNYYNIVPNTYPAVFTLISDEGETLKTVSKEMVLDNLAPVIEFDRDPVQSGSMISVAYTVKDRAYSEDDLSKCSGIKVIEFWDGATKLDEVYPSVDDSSCEYSDEIQLTIPSSDNIIIKAYDMMDHLDSEVSPEFSFDNDNPEIIADTFEIYRNGVPLEGHISGDAFSADIAISIIDESVDTSSTVADLSGLGAGSDVVASSCTKSGDYYICEWKEIPVTLISSTTVSIPFYTEDVFGNNDSETVQQSFDIDSISPSISYLGVENVYDGKEFAGSVPFDIVMKISDTGSGISSENLYLDLSDINEGYSTYQNPDLCENSSNSYWECYWYNRTTTKIHEASSIIYVTDAFDNTGNPATGISEATIYTDKESPLIENVSVTHFSEKEDIEMIVSGDQVVVTAIVDEDSDLRAFGDFSNIYDVSGADELEAVCTKEGTRYVCTWELNSVMSGYISDEVPLTFVDSAGNAGISSFSVEIYGREGDDVVPDYWQVSSVELMPSKLDRQTVPLINQRVYGKIGLASPQGAELLEMTLGDCSGDSGYLNEVNVINNQRGSTDPYIMFEFKNFDATGLNELDITCNLNIQSVYNSAVTNIEIEEVPVVIGFYNQPLGEPSEELQSKIDDLYDTYIDGWWKWIGGLTTMFKYANLICNTINTINLVTGAFTGPIKIFDGLMASPAAPAVAGQKVGLQVTAEELRNQGIIQFQGLDKFCKFINCELSSLPKSEETKTKKESVWRSIGSFATSGGILGKIDEMDMFDPIKHYTGKDPTSYLNVKDSMVLSLLTVCIPGVIYNLNKYRQIQCMYIDCLQTSLDTGIPASACDAAKEYATCKYWVGEIFQAFPYTALWNYYMNMIKGVLSNPLRTVGLAMGYVCQPQALNPTPGLYQACAWTRLASIIGTMLEEISAIFDSDTWEVTDDYCHRVEERGNGDEDSDSDLDDDTGDEE